MRHAAIIDAVGVIIGRPSEKSGNQPNFVGAEQQQKRLAVFLDGTWNSVNSNTNVWRMRALCAAKSKDGKPQLVYYEVGVNGFLGGLFGQGLDENIRLAYEWLIENYNDGDEIFIFGFSRGAFTARSLANLIAIDGILIAGSPALSTLHGRDREEPDRRSPHGGAGGDAQSSNRLHVPAASTEHAPTG